MKETGLFCFEVIFSLKVLYKSTTVVFCIYCTGTSLRPCHKDRNNVNTTSVSVACNGDDGQLLLLCFVMPKKHYAVAVGRKIGIFRTWDECSEQVGFASTCFRK
jgi:Caulimovirus viroplasmin